MTKFLVFVAVAFATVAFAAPVAHNDPFYSVDGVISELHFGTTVARGTDSHSFRVVLTGEPKMCKNAWTYAYLNDSDKNYQAIVDALLSAKASKATVTIGSFPDSVGYCVIRYVIVK